MISISEYNEAANQDGDLEIAFGIYQNPPSSKPHTVHFQHFITRPMTSFIHGLYGKELCWKSPQIMLYIVPFICLLMRCVLQLLKCLTCLFFMCLPLFMVLCGLKLWSVSARDPGAGDYTYVGLNMHTCLRMLNGILLSRSLELGNSRSSGICTSISWSHPAQLSRKCDSGSCFSFSSREGSWNLADIKWLRCFGKFCVGK